MVGCGTLAAYPVPGTTRWYVCGLLHRTSRYLRTPPGSRTPYPLIKSQVLWPDELEAHIRLVAMDLTPIQPNGTHTCFLTESWHEGRAHGGARRTAPTGGLRMSMLDWLTGH